VTEVDQNQTSAPTHEARSPRNAPLVRTPEMSAALVAALPAFVVYLLTVCPTIGAWDAGDLATASYTLGIAHPPGYPLYTLLGRLFALLIPVGDVGFRYNLFSAVAGTCAVGLTAALTTLVIGDVFAGVLAGWVLAFSTTWWSQCVVAEVYALNGVFFALVLFLLFRWGERGDARSLFLAAFIYGLGLAHHLSLTMAAPAIGVYVILRMRRAPFRWTWVPVLVALLALGPMLYLYIILRARLEPAYNFGNPSTWERFFYHIQAKAYYFRLVAVTSEIWLRRFFGVGRVVVDELRWIGAAGALAGIVVLARRRADLAATVLLVVAAYAAYTAAYRIPDIRVYYFPVLIALTLSLSAAVAALGRAAVQVTHQRAAGVVCAVAAAILPAVFLVRNYDENNFHSGRLTREWVEALHNVCTDGGRRAASLLILGDTDLFCSAYLTLVEHRHPELRVIDQAGNIFTDIYNVRGLRGARSIHVIRDEDRWIAEDSLIVHATHPIFYDPHPDYDLPHARFVQHGLVFQALRRGQANRDSTRDAWRYLPDLTRYESRPHVDPDTRHIFANYYIMRGIDALERHNRREAERYWDRADAYARDFADVHQNLSRFFLAVGESTRAVAECEKVIELVPDEGDSYGNYADVLLLMRDSTRAAQMYEKGMKTSGFLNADQYIKLANIYKVQKRFDQAILYYRYALGVQPHDPVGWAALASTYVRTRDLARAAYCNRRAIELDPNFAAAHGNLGFVYYNQERFSDAERELLIANRLRPSEPQPLVNLALLYGDLHRYDEATRMWHEVLRLQPGYPDAHFHLATLYEARGDMAAARREIEEELRLNPASTAALGELGIVLSSMGNTGEAARLWERVVALDPADARAHFNLGMYYTNSHDAARAIQHYRAYLRIEPNGAAAERARAALTALGARPQETAQ
jgi:tetratricopeptide (TPR) repeat protein